MPREAQRILVIDDSSTTIDILSEVMGEECELLFALNGVDGLALARREQPELILLDVVMPGMDGYEVCNLLKGDPLTRAIPVIFITALNHDEDEGKGLEMGAIDYVSKPINPPIFRARIRNHLALKRTEAALHEQAALLQQEVSQRTRAQELLLAQQQQLEALVDDEVRKNREKDSALMQSDKMASLGQMAAGVAHEVNNPMGYISVNLGILARYFDALVRFDRSLREEEGALSPESRRFIDLRREELGIEHILEDGVDLLDETREGAERVIDIARNLKNFSRRDAPEYEAVLLTSCLESALTIVQYELKYKATIRKEYGAVPPVLCHPGQLNQVFLNLLVNAGQAIVAPGEIVLRCWHDDASVHVSIGDSGPGMSEELREQIFEPFFTTKGVGEGTGLGLSISSEIIRNHRGELRVESRVGEGSTFTVSLPRMAEEDD